MTRSFHDRMRWTDDHCGCWRCVRSREPEWFSEWMILCPTCGNKRCPHASDHDFVCTSSNEPGQEGSVYR